VKSSIILNISFPTVELFGDLLWQNWKELGMRQPLTEFDIDLISDKKIQIAIEYVYKIRKKSSDISVF
jgi:hypothetical protein